MKKILSSIFLVAIFMVNLSAKDEVILQTNKGDITLKLYPKIAPKACENFVKLAQSGYYDGVIFHRVIKKFMIQGGDPTGTGRGGESIWKKDFEDEFKPNIVFDRPGILAMANRGANTNSSQFFITTVPTPWLNGRHTIFGEVIKGFDVVKNIENSKVDGANRPIDEIKIIKTKIN